MFIWSNEIITISSKVKGYNYRLKADSEGILSHTAIK